MTTVSIVWGTGTGPTSTASYDTALAAANVHNYNLVTVSSVLPAAAQIDVCGDAPPLGAMGNRLTVVQSRTTRQPGADAPAVAGLGWARTADGPGIFYEAGGSDPDRVAKEITVGLEHGRALRSERQWEAAAEPCIVSEPPAADAHVTAVVLGVYGRSRPIF